MAPSTIAPTCVADTRCNLGEAPLWSPTARTLYWLDISLSSELFEFELSTGRTRRHQLHQLASGLVLSNLGDLLVISDAGICAFDLEHSELRQLIAPPPGIDGMRFNDCGCDRLGRLWTGTMVNDLSPSRSNVERLGQIYRFDSDSTCHSMGEGLGCPNTFVWPPSNRTLLTADSAIGAIYAYEFDLHNGTLGERRIFADPKGLGIPDGSALDAHGYLWNARWGAGCIARFAPDGRVDDVVAIPADFITSCAFGGNDLDTLFITTARQGLDGNAIVHQPFAGGVFAIKPEIPGLAESVFRYDSSFRN